MYQGIAPVPQQLPEPAGGPPLHIAVPAALAGLVVALRAGRMLKKRMWVFLVSLMKMLARALPELSGMWLMFAGVYARVVRQPLPC